MRLAALSLSLAAATLPLVSASPHTNANKSHHDAVAHTLQKRVNGQATYYAVGLGACGDWNKASDYIVALNSDQLDTSVYPPVQCNRKIRISYNGKSAVATIKDECPPPCQYGDLDMSEGLFKHFEPLSVGVFQMTWEYISGNGGDDGDDDAKATTKKTTTTTHRHTTATTTTTSRKSTTTTTTKKSSSTTTTEKETSTTTSSSSTTSSAQPSATPSEDDTTTQSDDGESSIANVQQLIAVFANMASAGKASSEEL